MFLEVNWLNAHNYEIALNSILSGITPKHCVQKISSEIGIGRRIVE
jgi:hypothetical protein